MCLNRLVLRKVHPQLRGCYQSTATCNHRTIVDDISFVGAGEVKFWRGWRAGICISMGRILRPRPRPHRRKSVRHFSIEAQCIGSWPRSQSEKDLCGHYTVFLEVQRRNRRLGEIAIKDEPTPSRLNKTNPSEGTSTQ
jgi:hypothetical protein